MGVLGQTEGQAFSGLLGFTVQRQLRIKLAALVEGSGFSLPQISSRCDNQYRGLNNQNRVLGPIIICLQYRTLKII